MINGVKLNKMQQTSVEMYYEFIKYPGRRKRPWFEISGPAGSGKTTTVKEAIRYAGIEDEYVSYMALIGKATLALRLTGLNAKTIHSSIYDLVNSYVVDKETGDIVRKENGMPKIRQQFVRKTKLDGDCRQLVVDEGGMVGQEQGNDILSFGIPLLILGDLNQLPPVMAKRMFLAKPDVVLNEIMRQDKDSPIIYLSQLAIYGVPIPYGKYGNDECLVIHKHELTDQHLVESDIVICETNQMRDVINKYIRKKIKGIEVPYLTESDKILCRQNKWNVLLNDDIALVNGLIGYVDRVYYNSPKTLMDIDFRPEFYEKEKFKRISIDHKFPFKPYSERKVVNPMFSSGVLFEFGDCITCHLAQGSQYDTVLVYVEHVGNSLYFRQWLYTAITRAKKKLILVI